MAVINLTKENFEEEVVKSDKTVLIDFWAAWCGPCKMIAPTIDEISQEVTDAKICKVNVDEQPELASQFRISSIPTMVVIKKGQVTNVSVGAKPKADILELLK